ESSLRKYIVLIIISFIGLYISSCSPIISSIEHSELDTDVKFSKSVFLTPSEDRKKIYVRVTNTSGNYNLNFKEKLIGYLANGGYKFVDNPDEADYELRANILFVDDVKKYKAAEGAFEGSAFGALAGAAAIDPDIGGALAGWAVGAAAGAATGFLFPVKTFAGVVDVRVVENINGKQKDDSLQVAVKATQTRLDKEKASLIISDKLAEQVAALFL
ncbi:MAG: complement resistance protein TraT, partial [Deferribacterota bacterium]|nr:complement resistance protein TraT [Deferribacterota bacterium]